MNAEKYKAVMVEMKENFKELKKLSDIPWLNFDIIKVNSH